MLLPRERSRSLSSLARLASAAANREHRRWMRLQCCPLWAYTCVSLDCTPEAVENAQRLEPYGWLLRARITAGCGSPLRCLHHILELQEAVVCRNGVLGVHLREEVVRDRGAPHKLGHRVVHIHHRALWDRRDRLPEPRVHGLEI